MLATCQPGYERLLAGELAGAGLISHEQGPGWVLAGAAAHGLPELAFAHCVLEEPAELRGDSVNSMAAQAEEFFAESLRGERVDTPWPCRWSAPPEPAGLGKRVRAAADAFRERLGRRLARVARLAVPEAPAGTGPARGLFIHFVDFNRAFAARRAVLGGQRRMADDPEAPSRSYLKVEEAYGILGAEPRAGETVADLGAAPGGWSYSAARHGARVVAVDRGPLKRGAAGHPAIEHRPEDAFGFRPAPGTAYDWLFCDLVEEPHHVLRQLAAPWLARHWCRRFIINLKFGRADPLALLAELRAADSPFSGPGIASRIRHLYHDREEFTIVGAVGG